MWLKQHIPVVLPTIFCSVPLSYSTVLCFTDEKHVGSMCYMLCWLLHICCFMSHAAVLTFTPPVVNQLGGTPILISGFCVQPDDFIVCAFDKTSAPRAERIDDSTFMCVTPLMTSLGEVEVEVTKFFPQPSIEISVDNFITSMLAVFKWRPTVGCIQSVDWTGRLD